MPFAPLIRPGIPFSRRKATTRVPERLSAPSLTPSHPALSGCAHRSALSQTRPLPPRLAEVPSFKFQVSGSPLVVRPSGRPPLSQSLPAMLRPAMQAGLPAMLREAMQAGPLLKVSKSLHHSSPPPLQSSTTPSLPVSQSPSLKVSKSLRSPPLAQSLAFTLSLRFHAGVIY